MNRAEVKLQHWYRGVARRRELSFIKPLLKKWPNASVYLVGGMVRDILLNRPSKDYDFVVTGVAERTLLNFLKQYGKVNLVGRTFGVLKFIPKGLNTEIDIALPRLDMPGDGSGAYRDVVVVSRQDISIVDDLKRRDFSINALAFNLRTAELVDVVGGLDDLRDKCLRTVGDPAIRFAEDFSRILRGLRFAAVLRFDIEPKTWRAMQRLMQELNKQIDGEYVVPREVIGLEFVKSLYTAPLLTINLYDKSGAFKVLMPEVLAMKKCPQPSNYHTEGDVWLHSVMAVEMLTSRKFKNKYTEPPDAELILTVFLHDIGKPSTLRTPARHKVDRIRFDGHDFVGAKMARTLINRLKLNSAPVGTPWHIDADNVGWLIQYHLLLLNDNVYHMKATTLEKYFVAHPMSLKLQQLMLVDTLASIPPDGRPVVKHLRDLDKALKQLPRTSQNTLPPPLLSGDDVMKITKESAGPRIGVLLQQLREAQLAGKVTTKVAAKQYLKKL